jgi:hypothetical protein
MTNPNPTLRYTIDEIKSSKWYQGAVYNNTEELQTAFKEIFA